MPAPVHYWNQLLHCHTSAHKTSWVYTQAKSFQFQFALLLAVGQDKTRTSLGETWTSPLRLREGSIEANKDQAQAVELRSWLVQRHVFLPGQGQRRPAVFRIPDL